MTNRRESLKLALGGYPEISKTPQTRTGHWRHEAYRYGNPLVWPVLFRLDPMLDRLWVCVAGELLESVICSSYKISRD